MLESLRSIVQQVSESSNLQVTLDIIVSRVRKTMDVDVCSAYLLTKKNDRFVLMATQGLNHSAVHKVSLGFREGLVGMVAAREEPVNLEAADEHPKFQYIPETGEERFSSFLGVPVVHHRRVVGVLVVQQRERRRFNDDEESFLITLSAQLAGVIAHAEKTGDLDALTIAENDGLDTPEVEFEGIAGAPGIAIGTVVVVSPLADLYATSGAVAADPETERTALSKALKQTRDDIAKLEQSLVDLISEQERLLFSAYIQMLEDESLGREVGDKIDAGQSAQSAWSEVILNHCSRFEEMGDAYLRERASDLRDLGRRVLGHLLEENTDSVEYPDGTILVGEELTATNLGMVPPHKLAGLVSVQGSVNSHLAILARAMDVPTVMGVDGLRVNRLGGREVILDGYNGALYVNPTHEHKQHFQRVLTEDKRLVSDLDSIRDLPAVTQDGSEIELLVNSGLMADVKLSMSRGARGVGLFRSEVPFFSLQRFPTEEEQRQYYVDVLEAFAPDPVVMRTLDIGGDKDLPYFPIVESNPFLGWRGIRISLDHPELFLAQVRAMLKASSGLDNLSILLPMISGVDELDEALGIIYRAYHELTEEEGLQLKMPQLGAMIEVPSAVFLAEEISKRVDFVSVGSNDLTQYMLAVDRNNARVADLYESMHPAVLSALNFVARAARRQGKKACVCGELAGDPLGAVLLMAMGYKSLSMNASNLLRVKALIRSLNFAKMRKPLLQVLSMHNPSEVRMHLDSLVETPEQRRLTSLAPRPN